MLSDELLLVRELNCYDALLIKQIGRRFRLSDKSYTGYSKVLASYATTELLEAKWIPHPTKVRGGASVVYLVGKRGKALMRSNGLGDELVIRLLDYLAANTVALLLGCDCLDLLWRPFAK